MALTQDQLDLINQYEATVTRYPINIAPAGQPPQMAETLRISPQQIMGLIKIDKEQRLELVDMVLRAEAERNPTQRMAMMANVLGRIERSTKLYVGELASPNTPLEDQLDVFKNKGGKLVDGHYGIRRREE